jgi:uncharacterized protein (TIGR03545 family)
MARYNYLLARIVILALISLILWMSAKPLSRQIAQQYLDNLTGSKVDLGKLETDWGDGTVDIADFAVTDPHRPNRNLIQAEEVFLNLDRDELWRKRVVVKNGTMTGVRLDTPRTTRSALVQNSKSLNPTLPAIDTPQIVDSSDLAIQNWLDQVSSLVVNAQPPTSVDQTQAEADKIANRWASQLKELQTVALNAQEKLAATKSQLENLRTTQDNPLRNEQNCDEQLLFVARLRETLLAAQKQLSVVAESGTQEIETFVQRQKANQVSVNRPVPVKINQQLVTQILFDQMAVEQTKHLLEWIDWFHGVFPEASHTLQPIAPVGRDLVFHGQLPKPQFIIQSVDLEGSGEVFGQHCELAGKLKNYSTQPNLLDQPAELTFRAQGSQHFAVKAILDRRNQTLADDFEIQCPDYKIESKLVGNERAFLANLSSAASRAAAQVSIRGNSISGTIQLNQTGVVLHVDQLAEMAGGNDVRNLLNQQLNSIQDYELTITLSGEREKPIIQIRSDIGDKFSNAIAEAIQRRAELFVAKAVDTDSSIESIAANLRSRLEKEIQVTNQSLDEQTKVASTIETTVQEMEPRQKRLR